MASGADVTVGEDAYYLAPLDGAIISCYRDVVELLLTKGANVNFLGLFFGHPALSSLCKISIEAFFVRFSAINGDIEKILEKYEFFR